jgi:hypothetical protein
VKEGDGEPVPIKAEAMASRAAQVLSREERADRRLCELTKRGQYGKQQFRDEPERTQREARARQKPFARNKRPSKEGGGGGPQEDGKPLASTRKEHLVDASAHVIKEAPGSPRRQGGALRRIEKTGSSRFFRFHHQLDITHYIVEFEFGEPPPARSPNLSSRA